MKGEVVEATVYDDTLAELKLERAKLAARIEKIDEAIPAMEQLSSPLPHPPREPESAPCGGAPGVCDFAPDADIHDPCGGEVHEHRCGQRKCQFVARRCANHGGSRSAGGAVGGHRGKRHKKKGQRAT